MRARFSSPLGELAITLRAVRADRPGMRPKARRVTCVSSWHGGRKKEKERERESEGREKGCMRESKGGNESSAMLLEYRLPSSVETLLKLPVVGRQRDGKEGERETRAMQKGHRVHRALRATTRARTRVELAAKVMTSKGSLTSARQISITVRPPVYPFHQLSPSPPLSLSLAVPFSFPLAPSITVSFLYLSTRSYF